MAKGGDHSHLTLPDAVRCGVTSNWNSSLISQKEMGREMELGKEMELGMDVAESTF